MSSISVNTITDASGGSTTSINGFTPSVSNMAGRNRIINGDMRIDQRNAGASVTPSTVTTYTLDRWAYVADAASKASVQQSSTAPAGFKNSILVTSLSAYTPASGEEFRLNQHIEGLNVADFGWGTSDAKTVTLSFWVRSSLTGSFSVYLANSAYNRIYISAYTINSADTWEYKTVTVPGSTDSTWLTDNGMGIALGFELAAGAVYYGTNNTWNTSGAVRCTSSQTNLVATSGATFYITGVQLEEGSVATPFEHRQYGQELALCQRYTQVLKYQGYETLIGVGMCLTAARILTDVPLKAQMRAQPSCSVVGSVSSIQNIMAGVGAWYASSGVSFTPNTDVIRLDISYPSGYFANGYAAETRIESGASIVIAAEL